METINITKLTTSERLKLMEDLWDSLSKTDGLPPPAWHDAILNDRLRRLDDGEDEISPWGAAKRRIRARTAPK